MSVINPSMLIFFFTLAGAAALAQGSYTSANNNTGNWESASIWTKEFGWMAEPSTMSDVGGSYMFNINGYVTRNGNLTVSGGGGLTINDTLVITGNLSMTTSTGITVGTNGLLIVLGDFYSSGGGNKINVTGNGRVAIVGNYDQQQGSVTTGNAFYIYDDTPSFTSGGCNGGASVDGTAYTCPPPNTAALTNMLDDEQDLSNNDPPLEDFLESLGVTCGFMNVATAGQTICTGSVPTALSGGAVSSGTYLWEVSTTSATTGFTSAAGTNNAQTYSPGALTQTTWFRRKATRSGCTNTSSAIAITIEPNGTWRGTSNTSWTTAANWCGGVPTSTTDVVIKTTTTGNYPSISAAADVRNLTITTGTSVTLSSNTFNIYGSVTNLGTWTTTAGTVAFRGTAAQTVSGGPFTFNNLTIDNSSGTQVSFNNTVSVTGTLTLTAGRVDLGGNTLTLGTAGNSVGTLTNPVGATSWLYNGTLSRWFPSNQNLATGDFRGYFPMGSETDFRPFWVAYPSPSSNRPSNAGTIRVTHAANNTTNTVNLTDGASTIRRRQNSSWTVTTGNGLAGGTYQLRMGGTSFGTIGNTGDLRVMLAGSAAAGSNGTASGNQTSFLAARNTVPFANLAGTYHIGSVEPVLTPLPVKLISFEATTAMEGINIEWKTASEVTFDYYELERAGEDLNFFPIARIENQGGYNQLASYHQLDNAPLRGKNYYRLKSVDLDGSFEYSGVAWALWQPAGLHAYPNPVVNKSFELVVGDDIASTMAIVYDGTGKEIKTQIVTSGNQTVSLPDNLEKGIYYLKVVGMNKVIKLFVL